MFLKGHPIFDQILIAASPDLDRAAKSYETGDKYAGIWLLPVADYTDKVDAIVAKVNTSIGWPVLAKPAVIKAENESNPFTHDAILIQVVPREVGERNVKHGGDTMVGAYAELARVCEEGGIKLEFH